MRWVRKLIAVVRKQRLDKELREEFAAVDHEPPRSVVAGSVRAALRAGMKPASRATARSTAAIAP